MKAVVAGSEGGILLNKSLKQDNTLNVYFKGYIEMKVYKTCIVNLNKIIINHNHEINTVENLLNKSTVTGFIE